MACELLKYCLKIMNSGLPENFTQRPFVTDMLESLVKKDDDSRLLSVDAASGSVQVETSIDLSTQNFCEVQPNDVESAIDSALLRDDANSANGDVSIRIIFTVSSALTAYHFVTCALGILFYLVLLYDESKQVSIIVCSVTATLCSVLYFLAAWQRKNYRGSVFFTELAFIRILLVAAISQIIGNELLYLAEIVYMFQGAVIVIYTTKWPRDMPTVESKEQEEQEQQQQERRRCGVLFRNAYESRYANVCLIWLLSVSTLVWVIGIILFARVFFRELIWLWGPLLYLVIMLVCVYKWRYLGEMIADEGRYNISNDDRKLAVIEYYTDPIVMLWNKINGI